MAKPSKIPVNISKTTPWERCPHAVARKMVESGRSDQKMWLYSEEMVEVDEMVEQNNFFRSFHYQQRTIKNFLRFSSISSTILMVFGSKEV